MKVKADIVILFSREDVSKVYDIIAEAQHSPELAKARDECFDKLMEFFHVEVEDDSLRLERDGTDATAGDKG